MVKSIKIKLEEIYRRLREMGYSDNIELKELNKEAILELSFVKTKNSKQI